LFAAKNGKRAKDEGKPYNKSFDAKYNIKYWKQLAFRVLGKSCVR